MVETTQTGFSIVGSDVDVQMDETQMSTPRLHRPPTVNLNVGVWT